MTYNYNANILETEAKGIWIWSQLGYIVALVSKVKEKLQTNLHPSPHSPCQKKKNKKTTKISIFSLASPFFPNSPSWFMTSSTQSFPQRLRNLPRLSLSYRIIEVEARSVLPSKSVSTLVHVASFLLQTRGGFSILLLLLELSLPLPGVPYCLFGNPLSLIRWLSM